MRLCTYVVLVNSSIGMASKSYNTTGSALDGIRIIQRVPPETVGTQTCRAKRGVKYYIDTVVDTLLSIE